MFVPFAYQDDIFAKQSLNPMEFVPNIHSVDKVMEDERYHTYPKIGYCLPRRVYRTNDDIWLKSC